MDENEMNYYNNTADILHEYQELGTTDLNREQKMEELRESTFTTMNEFSLQRGEEQFNQLLSEQTRRENLIIQSISRTYATPSENSSVMHFGDLFVADDPLPVMMSSGARGGPLPLDHVNYEGVGQFRGFDYGNDELPFIIPQFPYQSNYNNSITIEIDPNVCDMYALIELYKCHQNQSIYFNYNDQNSKGVGDGANRSCKTALLKRVIDYFFETVDHWFIIPKLLLQNIKGSEDMSEQEKFNILVDNTIQKTNYILNLNMLSVFIKSCIASNVLLPKHLHPQFVQVIMKVELTLDEMMYYLSYMDPDMYKYVNNLDESYKTDPNKFQEIGVDFDSFEDMVRSRVVGDIDNGENELMMAFDFNYVKYVDAMKFDKEVSEPYEITSQMIINIFCIDEKYKSMWNELIMELSQEELKSMLVLFTGSSKITQTIYVYIDEEDIKYDLNIHACGYNLSINKRLFISQETLKGLKIYFSSSEDSVDDSGGYYRRLNMELKLQEAKIVNIMPVNQEDSVALIENDFYSGLSIGPPEIKYNDVSLERFATLQWDLSHLSDSAMIPNLAANEVSEYNVNYTAFPNDTGSAFCRSVLNNANFRMGETNVDSSFNSWYGMWHELTKLNASENNLGIIIIPKEKKKKHKKYHEQNSRNNLKRNSNIVSKRNFKSNIFKNGKHNRSLRNNSKC
jgi:hypothetical protein